MEHPSRFDPILKFIRPARYPEAEKNLLSKQVNAVLLASLTFVLLVVGMMLALGADVDMPSTFVTITVLFGLWLLLRSGQVALVGQLLLFTYLAQVAWVILRSGTIRNPVTGGLILVILIARLFFGQRASLPVAIGAVGLVAAGTYAELNGILTQAPSPMTLVEGAFTAGVLVLAFVISSLITRHQEVVLERADAARERLESLLGQLSESEDRYRSLFEDAPIGLGITELDGKLVEFNDAFMAPGSYSREDLESLGDMGALYCRPEDRDQVFEKLQAEGALNKFPVDFKRKDGSCFPALLSLIPVTIGGGRYWQAMVEDVTDRKRVEDAVARRDAILQAVSFAAEEFLKSSFEENIQAVLGALGTATRVSRIYIFENRRAEDGTLLIDQLHEWVAEGIEPQISNPELQGLPWIEAGFQRWYDTLSNGDAIFGNVLDFPRVEQEILLPQAIISIVVVPIFVGEKFWGFIGFDECERVREWTQVEVDSLKAAASTFGAAIQQADAEAQIKAREQHFRALIENSADGIMLISAEGELTYVSPAAEKIFGRPAAKIAGRSALEFLDQESIQEVQSRLSALMDQEGAVTTVEVRYQAVDGSWRWLEVTASNQLSDPVVGAIVGNYRDVTDRVRAQQEIERQVKELSLLHAVSTAAIASGDEDELLAKVTEFIGENFYPDNFGFLLLNEDGTKLRSHPSYRGVSDQSRAAEFGLDYGITGHVASTGKPWRVADVREEARFIEFTPNILSELSVPISIGGRVIGVINAESRMLDHFSDADERLLTTVAGQLATAIERMRAEKSEHEQRVYAEALANTAAALNRTLNFDEVLDLILEKLERVVPMETGNIVYLEGDNIGVVRNRGVRDEHVENWITEMNFLVDQVPNYAVMSQTLKPVLLPDAKADPNWVALPESDWIRSYVGAPIHIEGKIIGFINANHSQPGVFNDQHVMQLQAFASQAATTIENARLYKEIRLRARDLEALVRISAALRGAPTPRAMLPNISHELIRLFDAQAAAIAMVDPDSGEIVVEDGAGFWDDLTGQPIPSGGWVTEKVISSGESFVNNNIKDDPDPHIFRRDVIQRTRAAACIPLATQNQSIGAVWLGREDPLQPSDVNLLRTVCELAANALQRATLNEERDRHLNRMQGLRAIDRAIIGSRNLKMTLNILLDQVLSQLEIDAAAILLYNPLVYALEFSAGRGFFTNAVENSEVRLGEGHAGQAALTRRTVFVPNLKSDPSLRTHMESMEGFVSYLGVPLISKGQLIGIMDIYHRKTLEPGREWMNLLEALSEQAAIAIENVTLFDQLERSNMELRLAYDTTLEGWALALELRDRETEGHSQRVTEMTLRLARALSVSDEDLVTMRRGALLHDIGKMGIPDEILHKAGPLTEEEWEVMRRHPQFAYDLLNSIMFLRPSLDIPYCHHEKWDGTGYPRGLKGEEIPLGARIFSVIDVWDALLSDRPYRKAWPEEKVMAYLKEQSGKHFDPRILASFFELLETMNDV